MASSDSMLMEQHVEALFVGDRDARLLYVNEPCRPEEHPAPLVYAGAGGGVVVCQTRQDVPASLCTELREFAHQYADDRGRPPPELVAGLRVALEPFLAVGVLYGGPAYRFPDVLPITVGTALVGASSTQVLSPGFDDLSEELAYVQP
jgi:hypothetical protein